MKLSTMMGIVAIVSTTLACGPKATPVTPQPLSPQEQAQVVSSLPGTWKCTHTKVGDAEKKEQPAKVIFTITSSGTYNHQIGTPFGTASFDYKYTLEGKNMVTNAPHGTYRVDNLTATTLDLFNYDSSTVWYLARQ